MKESDIERKVAAYCKRNGLLTYKFVSPSSRGVPDRIIIGRDRIMFLELKQPGKKPTPLQEHEIGRINLHGGIHIEAAWADSYDWAVEQIKRRFFLA